MSATPTTDLADILAAKKAELEWFKQKNGIRLQEPGVPPTGASTSPTGEIVPGRR